MLLLSVAILILNKAAIRDSKLWLRGMSIGGVGVGGCSSSDFILESRFTAAPVVGVVTTVGAVVLVGVCTSSWLEPTRVFIGVKDAFGFTSRVIWSINLVRSWPIFKNIINLINLNKLLRLFYFCN